MLYEHRKDKDLRFGKILQSELARCWQEFERGPEETAWWPPQEVSSLSCCSRCPDRRQSGEERVQHDHSGDALDVGMA